MDKARQLGQYFTPDFVADFMVSLASKGHDANVLEPASGEGVFLNSLQKAGYQHIVGCEVDETLVGRDHVRHESFITARFDIKFDLVIGNPPYVRWKHMAQWQKDELNASPLWQKYFTSLSDYLYIFILRSVELLEEGGELLFITPDYWLSTLHARQLRNYLIDHGYVAELYRFSETPIFSKVSSSIVIFKYVKTTDKQRTEKPVEVYTYTSKKRLSTEDLAALKSNCEHFTIRQFTRDKEWVLIPESVRAELMNYEQKCQVGLEFYREPKLLPEEHQGYVCLGDIAEIANGLVSGLDKAFQIPDDAALNDREQAARLAVIKAKDIQRYRAVRTRAYAYLNQADIQSEDILANNYPVFYEQLQPYKDALQKRYAYNREIPYWDWVFPRSMKLFMREVPKLFVPCKERITNKDRLRFCYAGPHQYPTQDVTALYLHEGVREDLYYVLALLQSKAVYDWVCHKGLIKGGVAEFSERPLAAIPLRLIDWTKPREVALHNEIVARTRDYVQGSGDTTTIDGLITQLLQ